MRDIGVDVEWFPEYRDPTTIYGHLQGPPNPIHRRYFPTPRPWLDPDDSKRDASEDE